ncbi:MAG: division plane positioning ATPase MipZ [Pseudomonadales bacterium]
MSLRIVVLNPKGGSGKTTIATNLLAAYAAAGQRAALIDRDRQGSAMRWLRQRPESLPKIHGIAAFEEPPANVTRSFAMRVPAETERVVVDTPAALDRQQMIDAVRQADKILVPVLPSQIDIHAVTRCVADLLLHAKVARDRPVLGVVANRVRKNTLAYASLMRFLDSLDIPVIAELRDVQAYVRAAEAGLGLFDLKPHEAGAELEQWRRMLAWIDQDGQPAPVQIDARRPASPR